MPFAPGPGAGVLLSGKARQSQRLLQLLQSWAPRLPTQLPFTVLPHSVFQPSPPHIDLPFLLSPSVPAAERRLHSRRDAPTFRRRRWGDPELCATDEMIPFKDEGDPQKEKIFAEISHPEEEGDLADIKSSLVNESEIIPASNGHEVVRQTQSSQEPYHDKAREHPDDGKHPDGGLYNKGPSYSSYSGYIMMPNMNSDPYMSNGSLSPPIPRTSNKVPVVQPSHAVHPLTPLITYSDEHFSPGSHPSHIPSEVNPKQGMSRHPPAPEMPTFYPCLQAALDRSPHPSAGKVSLFIPSRVDSGKPTHPHCQATLPCPGFPIT